MDRARDFHFVGQMPRTTVSEVLHADAVYDRQVLLNESWVQFARRTGKPPAQLSAEHDKFVTETWAEWELRKEKQARDMAAFEQEQDRQAALRRQAEAERLQQADRTVERLMALEAQRLAKNQPPIHTLLLDFEQLRAEREARQRADVEREETEARAALTGDEAADWTALRAAAKAQLQAILDELERRRREKEEEENRIRLEQQRKADELKAEAERRKREQDEEERRKKEAAEEAKKAERRRKEEERRQRAKQEREGKAGAPAAGAPGAATGPDLGGTLNTTLAGTTDNLFASTVTEADRRNQAREKRLFRMQQEATAFESRIGTEAAACATHDDVAAFYKSAVERLGGHLLFHTCVYLAVRDGQTLRYKYASANCTDALRSGQVALDCHEHASAPTVSACVVHRTPTGVVPVGPQRPELLYLTGALPLGASGEFAAIPILASDGSGDVLGVVACDTLSCNTRDAASTFQPGEEACYDGQWADVSVSPVTLSALRVFADAAGRAETAARKAASRWNLDIGATPKGGWESYNALWSALCKAILRTGAYDCYVSRLTHGPKPEAVVVCHNGSTSTASNPGAPSHLLGQQLTEAGALTLTTYCNAPSRDGAFSLVADVAADPRCVAYRSGAPKVAECLLLAPLANRNHKNNAFVVGVSAKVGTITEQMAHDFVAFLNGQVAPALHDRQVSAECANHANQAAEWLHFCTGGANAYVSLLDRHAPAASTIHDTHLSIVAASDNQNWLVGKTWTAADGGCSHKFLEHDKDGFMCNEIVDIPHVKLWNDGVKHAPKDAMLVMAHIVSPAKLQPKPYGIVYVDTLNSDKKHPINKKTDGEMVQLAAKILGLLLDGTLHGAPLVAPGEVAPSLSVEAVTGEERIAFLKQLLLRARRDLSAVTKDQLLELARYNSPPEVIPKIVAATMIVQGKKPTAVDQWEESRKLIKPSLVEKMLSFDPTMENKPKSAFFLRARKMTKGLSAADVFSRGSYPTSCFFSWTFATILLRRASDKLRKRAAAGGDLDEVDIGSHAGSTADQDDDVNALPEEDDAPSHD